MPPAVPQPLRGLSRSRSTIMPGDPAPWFHQRSTDNPSYAFDTVAGRYVVLCFFGTAGDAAGPRGARRRARPPARCSTTSAPASSASASTRRDEARSRVAREPARASGISCDFDGAVSRLYGVDPAEARARRAGRQCAALWVRARSDPARHRGHPVRAGRQRRAACSPISTACRRPSASPASSCRRRSCSCRTSSSRTSAGT